MMKYSTTIFLFEDPLPTILEWVSDAGFDAIDIPGDLAYRAPNVLEEYGIYANQLSLGEVTGVWGPERDLINPDESKRSQALEYAKFCIEIAAELGSNLTHLCFMTNPYNLENTARETLLGHAVEATRTCYKLANDYGVTLMIEPLFKKDVTLVNRAEQAMEIWENALGCTRDDLEGMPIGLLLDAYHMSHEESSIKSTIKEYARFIKHVHVADKTRNIHFDDNSGFVRETLQALKDADYKGLVSLEPIPLKFDPATELKTALKKLKSIEASLK